MVTVNNAKNKAPTKAQRIRNNSAKAIARANKAALDITIEAAIVKAVHGAQQGEAACRVLAFALEREFGKDWPIWDSGNMRSDNEKAVFARLENYRKNCQELALNKGLSNINKPWSDAKRVQKEKNLGGRPNERLKKPMDARFKEGLSKLYRAWMKEEKFTDEEFAVGNKIGELLTFLKVDITKLG